MRCMRLSGRRWCPLLGGDMELFCASLVEGLAHLESTLDADGGGMGSAVSMRWCADAMWLLKRMQREMLAIFRKADAAAAFSSCAAGAGGWFEHYMQETAALLDFCNAFKTAVSRMHRYCMVVDFAAQAGCAGAVVVPWLVAESAAPCGGRRAPTGVVANQASPTAVRDELPSLKEALDEAERLGRTIVSGAGGDASGMVAVTLVAKVTTSILSLFVLQALTSPLQLDAVIVDGHPMLGRAAVPELEPWHKSLSLIHDRFPSRATVAEHEKVAVVVQDLVNGKMDGGDEQDLLRARSRELREGVELFDCVLDEVFDEVIRGRNEMLGILRDKALTSDNEVRF